MCPFKTTPTNCICLSCNVNFNHKIKDGVVECPSCGFIQPFPIIKVGNMVYYCISCNIKYGASSIESAICSNCGKKPKQEDKLEK